MIPDICITLHIASESGTFIRHERHLKRIRNSRTKSKTNITTYICDHGLRDDDRFQWFLEEAESEAKGLGLSQLAYLRDVHACLSDTVENETSAHIHLAHSLELR